MLNENFSKSETKKLKSLIRRELKDILKKELSDFKEKELKKQIKNFIETGRIQKNREEIKLEEE